MIMALGLGAMSAAAWNERAGSWPERYYAHGVTCALGWVLGVFSDPAIMAPIHRGDGSSVSYGEREEYRVRLRGFAIPPEVGVNEIGAWLSRGPRDATPARPGAARSGHPRPAG